MKKSSLSSHFLLGMATLSFCCYIYLHKVAFKVTGHCPSSSTLTISEEQETAETSRILLPDVALIKHFLTFGKMVLPKD
ncbi:MAG: hypothetical protein GC192_20470 [Bacteroidetes bacterium]|nr:hypothetical protein [Bacteroidota bacterium]